MRNIITIFLAVIMLSLPVYGSDESGDGALIATADCSVAIETLRRDIEDEDFLSYLKSRGVDSECYIANPFALGTYDSGFEYVFNVYRNDEIVCLICYSYFNKGATELTCYAIRGPYMTECIDQLKDGEVYILCSPKEIGFLCAVSENRVLDFYNREVLDVEGIKIDDDIKRTVVDVTKPLYGIDIKGAMEIYDVKNNGESVLTMSMDELGAINKNDRLLVPVRTVAELTGCNVEWYADSKTIVISDNDNCIRFAVNSEKYSVNDEIYSIDVPAEIYEGKTYVPVRAVSNGLGINIVYNSTDKTISLSY